MRLHYNIPRKTLVFFVFSLLLFINFSAKAQFDTQFWMPPVWDPQNGSTNNPSSLTLTTTFPTANVNVQTPDGTTFNQNYVVNTGVPTEINLSTVLGMTTNINNPELDKGLIITSDMPIQAVYRINANNNKAMVTLKGKSALGTVFRAGSQTHTRRAQYFNGDKHFVSVMATEDNTTVTFTTEQGFTFVGQGGNPTSVTLDAGETYVMRSDLNDDETVAGTLIESDKDIVATTGAQHVRIIGGSAGDAGIDQIVPIENLGNEYVVVKGGVDNTFDYAMVTAAFDNTEIFIDGAGAPIATINAGETYRYVLPGGAGNFGDGHYIRTSEPSYVYHVTGSGRKYDEVGMAIIPPIKCTGSRYIQFTPFAGSENAVMITIPTNGLATLEFNGAPYTSYPTSTTDVVPGLGGTYSTVTIDDADLTNNNIFTSDEAFHLGLLVGNGSSGTYGFLSGFSVGIDILDPVTLLPVDFYVADSLYQGQTVEHCILMDACDPDNRAIDITESPNTGSTSIVAAPRDTCFNYTASLTYAGNDTIQINVENDNVLIQDGTFLKDSAQLAFYVYAPPIADPDNYTYDPCQYNAPYEVLVNDTDPNNDIDTMSVTITQGPSDPRNTASVEAGTGNIIFTADPDFSGIETIIYEICDLSSPTPLCDTALITIDVQPGVTNDAGTDDTLCANNPNATLNGSISIVNAGYWSGGDGAFIADSTDLGATYIPSAAEVAAGQVDLILTSESTLATVSTSIRADDDAEQRATYTQTNSNDLDMNDGDREYCAIRYSNFNLPDGAVLISSEVIFTAKNSSTGDVTFEIYADDTDNSPAFNGGADNISNRTSTNNTVSWSPPDWVQGNRAQGPEQTTPDLSNVINEVISRPGWSDGNALTLVFRAVSGSGDREAWSFDNNNGDDAAELVYTYFIPGCPETKDTVSLIYVPEPTVDAGDDASVCANNAIHTLDGSFGGSASGITWSGGAGAFSDVNDINATYTPDASEISAGGVTLTIESQDDFNCTPVTDDMYLEITPVPTVDAGANVSVCANNPDASLNGNITIATAAEWTTTGTGTFADSSDLGTTYTPSAADITAGTIKLYLTTTEQGNCIPVVDSVNVIITPSPTVDAGSTITVCQNDPDATLDGDFTSPATGGIWSSAGGGSFTDPTDTTATYTPSTAEISAGIAEVVLTSTGSGNCLEVTDNVIIIISDSQSVDAGPTLDVCSNNPVANLDATTSFGITSVAWSGGAGTYSPANNVATTDYTATTGEVSGGSLTLTITASKPGCRDVSDDVLINFTPSPTANAGNDVSVCANNPDVALNGVVTVATGGSWQSIGGSPGTFTNANTLDPTYTPSATEISNGTARLVLTTTGNGTCNAVTDTIDIEITPAPTVDPGTYTSVCANNASIALNGNVTVATGGQWSAGGGTFNPSSTNLGATYIPTAAEISAGVVNLTLTSTGNDNCNAVFSNTTIAITPAPVANPGTDGDVCEDNPTISLNGSVTVASGGTWTGGAGTFNPNNQTLNATYQPTPTEVTNGTVTLTLTTTGNDNCNAESDNVTFDITSAPTVDAGSDQTVCGSNSNIPQNGTITVATGGRWTTSGDGSFSPNATTVDASYEPGTNDILASAVTLTLTTTGNGNCNAYSDEVDITFTAVPSADAGDPQTVCTNDFPIQLDGSGSQSVWSGGTGTFDPDNSTLNATYTPSAAEITAGSVTLTQTTVANGACNSVSDQVTFTILPGPIADAGGDDVICASDVNYTLAGNISGTATGSQWYTSGTGTFDDATSLNATYTVSNDDTAARSVFLVLETTGTGFCTTMRDTMELTITPAVYALPGNDRTICANTGPIPLFGRTIISNTGEWSGGAGTFNVDNSDLTGTYTPTAGEITAGNVTLTLTTTDNGACNAHSDDVTFTIEPAPTVDIGNDLTVCADTSDIPFSAAFTVASGVEWTTTGSGVFSTANTNTNVTYSPTAADTTAGSIYIKATTTGNGICLSEADSIELTITPIPVVNAGGDQLLCADVGTISIDANISFATGGTWTTSGSGNFLPDNNTIDIDYALSSADSLGGVVTLTLTSTGNGTCRPVEDKAIITLSPAPTIEAGGDQIVCANDDQIDLIALTTIATGGTWSTSGTGTFNDPNALATFYVPSSADTSAGSVRLFIESTGNGDCNPVIDSLTVTFEPIPSINVGEDTTICADYGTIPLAATFNDAGGMIWSSTGSGIFSPSSLDPNATYSITAADTAAGSIFLIGTTTANGPCAAEDDSLLVTINPAPYVNAGDDITVCGDTSGVQLDGEVIIAAGGVWTTSGTGTFSPDATTLDAIYIPSAADTAVGGVTLTLTSTGNDLCQPVADQLIISIDPAPYVNAGNDRTICADLSNINLDGTVLNAGGGLWTTSGSGIFSPSGTSIDPVYTPSSGDKTADSVLLVLESTNNGLCKTYYDTITLKIDPIPTIEAGPNRTICESQTSITLNGGYSNAGGGLWTTNGAGSFFPNNVDSTASYRPDASDSIVTIYYEATDIGSCNPVIDSMRLRLVPLPIVNAGDDIDACTDEVSLDLNGSVLNATGAGWITSGSGTFIPDSSGTTVSYQPSALDRTVGTVILTIESFGSAPCAADQDNLTISFTEQPQANAGPDQLICIKDDSVSLSGIPTNSSGGFWYAQNGFGSFNPNADSTTVVYYIAPEDTLQGSVTFEFWAEGTIPECSDAIDEMTITFNSAPVIDAGGPIMDACADTSGFTLNGSGSSGTWSGGTGTFVPNNTTLNATYKPTLAEIGAGSVNLTLTSNSSGACPPNVDGVQIDFQPVPSVDAGGNQTICADTSGIQFPATVDVASQVQWVTSGSGTFSPDATTLQPTYIPSAKDLTDSTLTFTVSTTDNGICDAATDRITLYINPAPVVNAGLDEITCADRDTMFLSGIVENATGGEWSTTGDGAFDPDEFTLDTDYLISSNDSINGGVTIFLTSTGNGFCRAVTDTVELTLTPAVAADAGLNDTICASENAFQLAGSVTTALGGRWSTTNGTGTFSPNEFALNARYVPSAGDKITEDITLILTTTNNGTCFPVKDTLELNVAPLPEADAGANQTICANNVGAGLNGFINNAGGGIWETNGTGAFSPDATTLNATYVQSQDDIDAGAVLLSLSTTGNGFCDTVTSFVNVTIEPAPVSSVNAGLDQTICADINDADVTGTIQLAGGGLWSTTGTGDFADTTDLTTKYTFSANDFTQPFIDMILTSTDNGLCLPVTDTSRIFINPAPTVDAGTVPIVCADINEVPLDATVTVSTGGIWRASGTGIFTPNSGTVDPTYIPSELDRSRGIVALAITTTGNGLCKPVTDFTTLQMTPPPSANAGVDQIICEDKVSTALNGKITIAGGGQWTSSGSGTFLPDNTTLQASYEPSQADKDAEVVFLTLTSTNNGLCNAVFDRMRIDITDAPEVEASNDQLSCANNPSIQLNGTVLNATGGIWSGGAGTFSPNNSTLNARYTPSPLEITNGSVSLTLTSTGNPLCLDYSDNMTLDVVNQPVVNIVSSDICAEIGDDISASGSVVHSDGRTDGIWSSSTGSPTFAPAVDDPNIAYTPTTTDINNGRVTLILTSDANGTCLPVSDEIEVILKELPSAEAGVDQTICRGDATTLSAVTYPDLDYEWYQINGTSSLGTGTTLPLTTSQDTTIILTVTDFQNCSVNDTVTVFVIDPPTFNLNEFYCFENEDTLIDSDPIPNNVPGTYQWYTDGRSIFREDSTKLLVDETGEYVVAFNNDRCSVFDTTNITQPVLDNKALVNFCKDDDGAIEIDAGPGYEYWFIGTDDTVSTSTELVDSAGVYNFIVFDQFGCSLEDSITVVEICAPKVFVPSGIRPGGDPSDDKMEIFGVHYTNFTLTIYNRWGEVIYYTEDPENPWDGFYLDELMPVGTYPYIITYEGLTDRYRGPYQKEGKVTIIK